jgi:hypothetical protein
VIAKDADGSAKRLRAPRIRPKWSGTEIKLDGEELLIMKEADIMGVLS